MPFFPYSQFYLFYISLVFLTNSDSGSFQLDHLSSDMAILTTWVRFLLDSVNHLETAVHAQADSNRALFRWIRNRRESASVGSTRSMPSGDPCDERVRRRVLGDQDVVTGRDPHCVFSPNVSSSVLPSPIVSTLGSLNDPQTADQSFDIFKFEDDHKGQTEESGPKSYKDMKKVVSLDQSLKCMVLRPELQPPGVLPQSARSATGPLLIQHPYRLESAPRRVTVRSIVAGPSTFRPISPAANTQCPPTIGRPVARLDASLTVGGPLPPPEAVGDRRVVDESMSGPAEMSVIPLMGQGAVPRRVRYAVREQPVRISRRRSSRPLLSRWLNSQPPLGCGIVQSATLAETSVNPEVGRLSLPWSLPPSVRPPSVPETLELTALNLVENNSALGRAQGSQLEKKN